MKISQKRPQIMRFFVFALVFSMHLPLFAKDAPVEVSSPVEKIFAPNGFDTNDRAEVILSGFYPNPCHKVGKTGFYIDSESMEITVWATSYKYPQNQNFCTQMQIPFTQTVELGILKEGSYTVRIVSQDSVTKQGLRIQKAVVETPDDVLYAPVSQVLAKKQSVTIAGEYPELLTGCMRISEVAIDSDPGDVLVIRPIAEILSEEYCQTRESKFSIEKTLPAYITRETLIHTRVTNGNSLNIVVR